MSEPGTFGKRLKALRIAVGLTQAELAESSGISERTVSDLERGLRASAYPSTARRLAAALGVGDSDTAAFLAEARGQASPEADDGLGALPADQRSRLPVPLTRLLGRRTELVMLQNLLRDPEVRLVTLTGPGGIGKTRLATEAALLTEKEFGAGVFFVNLSAADDPAMVLPAVAGALGLLPDKDGLAAALTRRLGDARALVVLDTFEHLLPAATAVGDLAAACPGLIVLATSRSPLHLRGEREVPLRPLAVTVVEEDDAVLPPAVELFLERARAVSPSFGDDAPAIAAVREICARLDGIPLAIELAATRVRHMPIADLVGQLDNRLDPLVGGARDLPARQRTMRTAMDWSYELLSVDQMRGFRAIAPFRGGFDVEAAAAVMGPDDEAGAVLGGLSALVDSSLVRSEVGGSGAGRFDLLDVTREYAVERAGAAGELEGLRRRHAVHFLALAEHAEPELRGGGQQASYRRLLDDEGNFRAALAWALETGDGDVALRLAGALWMFWRWAGLFVEGRAWLDAALTAGDASSLEDRCQASWGAGWLAYHRGDYGRTAELGSQMLRLLADSDSPVLRRNGLTLVGNAAMAEGRGDEAITALREAVSLCEPTGGSWYLATSLLNVGIALLSGGQEEAEAMAGFERALAIYEDLGDRHFAARTLIRMAYTRLARGDAMGAGEPVGQAMEIVAELGDGWSVAEGLEAVATVHSEDAPRTAAVLAGAAGRLRERIGMLPQPPDAAINSEHLERTRRRMTASDFEEALSDGRALDPADAVSLAQTLSSNQSIGGGNAEERS